MAGSIEGCRPTLLVSSSGSSLIESPAFPPSAMLRSTTEGMQLRLRRSRTSVAIPISSERVHVNGRQEFRLREQRDNSNFIALKTVTAARSASIGETALCHKRAIRFGPLCAKSSLFATCQKCFRAGVVLGKCLISKWDLEESVIQVSLTLNH